MKKTGFLSLILVIIGLSACDTARSAASAPAAPTPPARPVKQMATPSTDGSDPNMPPPPMSVKKTPPRGGEPLEIGPVTPVNVGRADTLR